MLIVVVSCLHSWINSPHQYHIIRNGPDAPGYSATAPLAVQYLLPTLAVFQREVTTICVADVERHLKCDSRSRHLDYAMTPSISTSINVSYFLRPDGRLDAQQALAACELFTAYPYFILFLFVLLSSSLSDPPLASGFAI